MWWPFFEIGGVLRLRRTLNDGKDDARHIRTRCASLLSGFLRAVWNHIWVWAEDFHLLNCVYSGRPAVFTQSKEPKWNKKRIERGKWSARHCLTRIAIDVNNVERLTEGEGQKDLFHVAYFRVTYSY